MVVDIEERCKSLDIDPTVIDSAQEKLFEAVAFQWPEGGVFDHLDDFDKVLTDDEIVAYVRWYNLHETYPEHFTWNGLKS